MAKESKAKKIADLLETNCHRWLSVWDIINELIGDFNTVPTKYQHGIVHDYATYIPAVRAIIDERNLLLLRQGWGKEARFKIATLDPLDRAHIDALLKRMSDQIKATKVRRQLRGENSKIDALPPASLSQ